MLGRARSGLHAMAGPVMVQAQYESNVYDTNPNQMILCAAKIDEKFAMLIPRVAMFQRGAIVRL